MGRRQRTTAWAQLVAARARRPSENSAPTWCSGPSRTLWFAGGVRRLAPLPAPNLRPRPSASMRWSFTAAPVERQCRGGAVPPRLSSVDRPDDGPAGPISSAPCSSSPCTGAILPTPAPPAWSWRISTSRPPCACRELPRCSTRRARRYLDSRRRRRPGRGGRRAQTLGEPPCPVVAGRRARFDLMLRRVGEVRPACREYTSVDARWLASRPGFRAGGHRANLFDNRHLGTHRISSPAS